MLTTILDDPTGYGRIIRDSEGNVLRIVEQKDANSSELAVREVNTSVYVFDAKLLAEAIANLKSNNAQGEFYLTDALEAAKANGAVGAFAAPDPLSVEGVNEPRAAPPRSPRRTTSACASIGCAKASPSSTRTPRGSRTTCRSHATR